MVSDSSIAIFRTSPSSMAGTVGAIFNGALQLGSAVGLAAVSSIQTSVEAKHGGTTNYAGRAAAFWFVLAVVCIELVSLLVFYRIGAESKEHTEDKTSIESEKSRQMESITVKEKAINEKSGEVVVSQV